ncbi:helix-turn-helix domain-containing protein [Bacillus weihaiensis]|uniref:helix-turn-helix domain-containing protein n=1 Tax=Bacillus weihaiensis TaxID=1547283 RepID=UPI00235379FC|nr:helix-turn-helix domain-containing protein [Bacillus weihaiensis]
MTKMDQKEQFIEMRAKEVPYEQISKELGVSKPTLIKWGKELEFEVSNRKSLELELLHEKYYVSKKKRIEFFGEQMNQLNAELKKRDLSEIPTEKIIELRMKTISLLKQEETTLSLKEKKSIGDSLMDSLDSTIVEWKL